MSTPNPENGGFILNRPIAGTILSNQEASGFPASNVFRSNPNQIFLSDGTNLIGIAVPFTQTETISGIAIINHTILSSANIRIHFYQDADFQDYIKSIYPTFNIKNLYQTFSPITCMSIKVIIENSPQFYIGELYPGTAFQFPYNYEWGYEETFNVVKDVVTTDEGVHFEEPATQAPEFSRYNIKFSNSPEENLSQFYDCIRAGKKVFIPSYAAPECYFGVVPDKELKATRTKNGDEYSIRFWEDAISGVWQV